MRSGSNRVSIPALPGVWVLAIFNVWLAVSGLYAISPALSDSLPENWDPASAANAPYFVALYVCIIIAAVGAWLGIRVLRTALIVLVGVLISFYLRGDWLAIELYLIDADAPATSVLDKLSLILGPALRLSYLFLNCWYFFGPRTRTFYGGDR